MTIKNDNCGLSAKAIETAYSGYRFRSRLEARWAIYFDALGVVWEYENEGYDLPSGPYLPDFWLPQVGMFGEVKSGALSTAEMTRATELVRATGYPVLLLVGVPDYRQYMIVHMASADELRENTGWLIVDGCVVNLDCIISMYHNYPIDEGRFFTNAGATMTPEEVRAFCPDIHHAITAARSARFEHGEAPKPIPFREYARANLEGK